jgi:hypothetical protein
MLMIDIQIKQLSHCIQQVLCFEVFCSFFECTITVTFAKEKCEDTKRVRRSRYGRTHNTMVCKKNETQVSAYIPLKEKHNKKCKNINQAINSWYK